MWGLVKKKLSISKKLDDENENKDKDKDKSNNNNKIETNLNSPNKSMDISSVQQRSIKITFPKDKSFILTESDIRLKLAEYGQINNVGIKEKHAVVLFLNSEDAYFCSSNINKIFGSDFKGKYMGSMFSDLTNTSRLNNINEISQIENIEIPIDNNSSNLLKNGEGIILTEVLNDQSSIFLDEQINDESGIIISNSFNLNTSIQNNRNNNYNNNIGRITDKVGLKLDNGMSFNESKILFAQSPTSQMMMSHHNDNVDEYEEEEEDYSQPLEIDSSAGVETMEGFDTSENDVSIQINKRDKRGGSLSLYDIEDSNSDDGNNSEDDDNNNFQKNNESVRLRSFTQIDITRNEIDNSDYDDDDDDDDNNNNNKEKNDNIIIDSPDTSLVKKLLIKTTNHQAVHQFVNEIPNNNYQSDDISTSTISSSSMNQWKVAKHLSSPVKTDVSSTANSSLLAISLTNSSTSHAQLIDDGQHKLFYQNNKEVINNSVTEFDEIEKVFEFNIEEEEEEEEEEENNEISAVISVTTRQPRTIVVGLKSPDSKEIASTSIQQIDNDKDNDSNKLATMLDLSHDDKNNSTNTTSINNIKSNISPEKTKFPENNRSSVKYTTNTNISQELVYNTSIANNNFSNLISNSSQQSIEKLNNDQDWQKNMNSSNNKSQLNVTKQKSKPPVVSMSPTDYLESPSNNSQSSQINRNNSINNDNYKVDSIYKSQITNNTIKNESNQIETSMYLKLERDNNLKLLEKIKKLEDEIIISKAVARVRERERLDYEKEAKKCEEDWATELTALSIRNLSLEKELFIQKELVMKMKIDSITKDALISSLIISKDNAELLIDGAKSKAERDSLSTVLSQKKLVEILDNQRISVENQTQFLKKELNTLRTDYTKVVEENLQWKQEVIKLKQEVTHISNLSSSRQDTINDIAIEKENEKDCNSSENHLFESFSSSTRKLVHNETNKYLGHLTPSVKRIDNLISPTTTQTSILRNSSLKSPQITHGSIHHVNFKNQLNEEIQDTNNSNNYQENQEKEVQKEIEFLNNEDEKSKNIENIQVNIITSNHTIAIDNSKKSDMSCYASKSIEFDLNLSRNKLQNLKKYPLFTSSNKSNSNSIPSHVTYNISNSSIGSGFKSDVLKDNGIKLTKPIANIAPIRKPKSAALNSYYKNNF